MNQSGNVLFLILIAVALFAALSYAVTSSTRTNGSSASSESAMSYASTIIQYTTSVRSAIQRMKLSNDCTDYNLNFANSIYKRNNGNALNPVNPSSPATGRCDVFGANGGGIAPLALPYAALDSGNANFKGGTFYKPGHGEVLVIQFKGIGTDGAAGSDASNDLSFAFQFISKDVCSALNKLLGIQDPRPAATCTGAASQYSGSFTASTAKCSLPAGESYPPASCSYDPAYGGYSFSQILLER